MRTGTLTGAPLAKKTGALPRSCYLSSRRGSPASVSMRTRQEPICLPSGWRDLSRMERGKGANGSRHIMHLYEAKMAERRGGAHTNASGQEGRSD
jgi:hypothetical protein